ncbi:adenosylmethionine decarboxylase [Candidatus Woesearchaeota archaeon]|nr:adenosylmethionine decarboxylase [Candidatus Woesearchaeota archaeon]
MTGAHILVDMWGCPADVLEKVLPVKRLLNEVVSESRLTKVSETFHQFKPIGVTGVIVLAESHISMHTWPEKDGHANVDIFCCSGIEKAEAAYKSLLEKFKPAKSRRKKVLR